ncbi:MAG: lytic murein transglycosylase B [Mariprofundaceae bacterium]|nr:lytic murein transglycosylase B [Mariprofundaceae bacterium]
MPTTPTNLSRCTAMKACLVGFLALTMIPNLLLAQPSHEKRLLLIDQLVQETGMDRASIAAVIKHAVYDESIITRMKTPYESRSYAEYRPLFVHPKLALKGHDYLQKHHAVFIASEKKYGIQQEIIAAILGIETRYGTYRGKDAVVSSLYTLATGYPRRANFFRKELGELLLLCQEEGLNPVQFKGSYAGAFGTTQFIPSSFRAYAVDANHDGKRDVWDSPEDIINSVANYFSKHGWDGSRPIAQWLPKAIQNKQIIKHAKQGFKHWVKLRDVRALLPQLDARWQDDDKVTLIEMTTKKGKQIALIHYNFYVITRWNRSYNYAMAITELAELMDCQLCQTHVE